MAAKIKILFILSNYTAFHDSIRNKSWKPSGMPTVTKLFEKLEKNRINFKVILVDKAGVFTSIKSIRFNEFTSQFNLFSYSIPAFALRNRFLHKLFFIFNEILLLLFATNLIHKDTYNLVYLDKENVTAGAFLAVTGKRVILRIHGITGTQTNFLKIINRFRNPLKYLSYLAPFKYIIATEDGSPVKHFLESIRNKNTKYVIMLNGVEKKRIDVSNTIRKQYNIHLSIPIILFVGRLTKYKGADVFAKTILALNSIKPDFHAFIIGNGPLYGEINGLLSYYGRPGNISLLGPITQDKLKQYYAETDIYVSLNKYGNISNTVLESLAAGNCIVTYKAHEEISSNTERCIEEVSLIVDNLRIQEDLLAKLNKLIINKKAICQYKLKSKQLAEKILISWEDRIDKEVDILKQFSSGFKLDG